MKELLDMATVTAQAEMRATPAEIWTLWTDPAQLVGWLPISTATDPLSEDTSFTWVAAAPFVTPVRITGRVRRLVVNHLLRYELDLAFSPEPSTLTVELVGIPGPDGDNGHTRVMIRHDDLPDDDLGLFETNGYAHYWLQHLESLTARAEHRPSDHHHRVHVGVYFIGGHPAAGVLVGGVVRDSPVHRAGLRAGDVVRAVDGIPVRSIVEFDTWLDAVAPGATAAFSLLRTELSVRIPHTSMQEGGDDHERHEGDRRVRLGPG